MIEQKWVNFQEVSLRSAKRGKCPICGCAVSRSQKFWQTLNPFNKNADGLPKSRKDIMDELWRRADAWQPDFTHDKCRKAQ